MREVIPISGDRKGDIAPASRRVAKFVDPMPPSCVESPYEVVARLPDLRAETVEATPPTLLKQAAPHLLLGGGLAAFVVVALLFVNWIDRDDGPSERPPTWSGAATTEPAPKPPSESTGMLPHMSSVYQPVPTWKAPKSAADALPPIMAPPEPGQTSPAWPAAPIAQAPMSPLASSGSQLRNTIAAPIAPPTIAGAPGGPPMNVAAPISQVATPPPIATVGGPNRYQPPATSAAPPIAATLPAPPSMAGDGPVLAAPGAADPGPTDPAVNGPSGWTDDRYHDYANRSPGPPAEGLANPPREDYRTANRWGAGPPPRPPEAGEQSPARLEGTIIKSKLYPTYEPTRPSLH